MSDGGIIATWVLGIALVLGLIFGLAFGCPAYNRMQKRANANNNVKVTSIMIRNQQQRVKIAQQSAQIRIANAIGVRKAQDHIAKTLTPLYVQWEAIQAELAMANSKNNSMVYIPVGANGVPLVSTTNQPQVLSGNK
jgi:uncharacterized membrane-anchored protein YhcB (DUF1043 family)